MQLHFNQEDGTLVTSHVQAKSSGNTVYGGAYVVFFYRRLFKILSNDTEQRAYDGGQILALKLLLR